MSVNLNFPNLTLLTNGSPYTYVTLDEYINLSEIDPNKVYWILYPDFTHAVYNNGIFIEGAGAIFWRDIQNKVRKGTIQDYYSIGDQLSVNYNGSAVMFDIVAFDVATPADSNYTHSMTLMPHDCLDALMFDNKEPSNSNSDRKNYGNNRYLHSNIRKWLNSSESASNWWIAQHSKDAKPDYVTTRAGFMSYFDNDFLFAIGKTKIKVAKDTEVDGGGYEEISDDYFYLPSRTEVGLANEDSIAEGALFPYFDSNEKRIKYYNGSANYWWMRTPSSNDPSSVCLMNPSGVINANSAYQASGVAPVCNII